MEGEAKLIESGASNAVAQFQAAYTVDMIAEEEKSQGVVYSFIEPFLQLFLSHHTEVKTLGAFAFAVLVQKGSVVVPSLFSYKCSLLMYVCNSVHT